MKEIAIICMKRWKNMSKFCVNCGNELPDNASQCAKCGNPVAPNTIVNQTVINNKPKASNGCAVAGFVISLVSLLCCGTTSTIGLILSIIGLVNSKKCDGEGKGLAIAGIIISCIFVILFIALMALGIIASIAEGSYTYTY